MVKRVVALIVMEKARQIQATVHNTDQPLKFFFKKKLKHFNKKLNVSR